MSSRNKTGLMNIKPNKVSYKILQWMQEHEGTNALKQTTGHVIAEKIAALPDVENGELTIEQTFSKMVNSNVVYRDRRDKSIYSDYRINYWHKSIPSEILANAPAEVKRAMAKTLDDMKPNQYMDDEGCVVTPNAVEKTEDPFSEDCDTAGVIHATAQEIASEPCGYLNHKINTSDDGIVTTPYVPKEPGTFENPILDEKYPWEEEPKEETTTLPLHITKTKDGKTTNVTINLTINI